MERRPLEGFRAFDVGRPGVGQHTAGINDEACDIPFARCHLDIPHTLAFVPGQPGYGLVGFHVFPQMELFDDVVGVCEQFALGCILFSEGVGNEGNRIQTGRDVHLGARI